MCSVWILTPLAVEWLRRGAWANVKPHHPGVNLGGRGSEMGSFWDGAQGYWPSPPSPDVASSSVVLGVDFVGPELWVHDFT